MCGNDDLGERLVTTKHHVTALLSLQVKAGPLERATHLLPRETPGKLAQRAETSISTVSRPSSTGTGRPSSSSASI